MAIETVSGATGHHLARPEVDPSAATVRYVKRGRFRMPEPVPDHVQAAREMFEQWPFASNLCDIRDKPHTLLTLAASMAYTLASLEYTRLYEPEKPIGKAMHSNDAYAAMQAKALCWASRDRDELHPDTPAPKPVVVTADDCRARFLDLYREGRLHAALMQQEHGYKWVGDDECKAMADAANALCDDLRNAGTIVIDETGSEGAV